MNKSQRFTALPFLFFVFILAPLTSDAGNLSWPIDCTPGDSRCSSNIGYPDTDNDGVAHNCSSPGYAGHHGTDISVFNSAVAGGVDVLAADDGEILFVFDGHDDDCPSASADCQAPPEGWFEPGQSNGYRRCTATGPYCPGGGDGCFWCFDGGNVVVMKHPGNAGVFATRYDHFKKNSITVQEGDTVSRGQKIGEAASAGSSTGPHLHFEVWGSTFYDLVDPWVGQCGPNTTASMWQNDPPWANTSPPGTATNFISPTGTITSTTPTFSWDAVTHSTWYYLWVNDSTGVLTQRWYTDQQLGCTSGGTCSISSPDTLAPGNINWWVRTWNEFGIGPWSSTQTFAVTAGTSTPAAVTNMIAPVGSVNTNTPTYQWSAVDTASWYYLWVNDASGNIIKKWYTRQDAGCADDSTCEVTPATAVSSGTGYWWVRTWNTNGLGPWSSAASFIVD